MCSYVNHHSQPDTSCFSNYGTNQASNLVLRLDHDGRYSEGNGFMIQLVNGDANVHSNTNGSNAQYEKHLIQKLVKRTLSSSFLPSVPHSKSDNSRESEGNCLFQDIRRSHHSAGAGGLTSKNYVNNIFSTGNDDNVTMLDKSGSRILPDSLMRGRPAASAQYTSSFDPVLRAGIGEERIAGHDERLIYQAALQDLSQPKFEADLPNGLLSVALLRHQKIALAWMLQKETKSVHCLGGILADDQGLGKTISVIALIQMQKFLQSKSKTEDLSNHKAEALNLDDDDDDDDKTGSRNLENVKPIRDSDSVKWNSEAGSSKQAVQSARPAAGTLIVCPATVLRQWARELEDKAADGAKLSVLLYHGGSRTKNPSELAKYDVVLTTYSIVTNEVPKQPLVNEDDIEHKVAEEYGLSSEFSINKKRKKQSDDPNKHKKGRKSIDACSVDSDCGALAKVVWLRVVLDEAQTIKNHRTQVARSCCGLRAKRRWCLSGTPIQNAVDELYSYFRFLRYEPYCAYKGFCEAVKLPISRDSKRGFMKLQAVLKAVMLRRTKDTVLDGLPIISLPPKFVELKRVNFTAEERAFYIKLEAESRSLFKEYAAAGTVNQNYVNILLMLLRLRQACDHPLLVKGFCADTARRTSMQTAKKLPRCILVELLRRLESSVAICPVCCDPPEDAIVTKCGHVFCYQCVSDYLTGDDNTCLASECKKQLSPDVVFSKSTLRSCLSDDDGTNMSNDDQSSSIMNCEYSSSKIKAALEILQSHCKSNSPCTEVDVSEGRNGNSSEPDVENSNCIHVRTHRIVDSSSGPIKTIVFSQWTSMLDLFEIALNHSCIQYRRLDGTMTLASRDRAVREFNIDPEVTAMLMSLKAGNLGLNMVAACHVILLDLWWNPTTEDQAVDRAHRIGQTRPVTVSRLTIRDTVEDRILALQEEKRKMVASAFGEDTGGNSGTRLTIGDLKYLFNLQNSN
ncbi:Helicase-like transcription factor chr28 [Ancistrocladus abbreviatus]